MSLTARNLAPDLTSAMGLPPWQHHLRDGRSRLEILASQDRQRLGERLDDLVADLEQALAAVYLRWQRRACAASH